MLFYADLHVHSHYSRATATDLTLEGMYRWAQYKGITVVATGDFTHPKWRTELREKLTEAETGLFALKKTIAAEIDRTIPQQCRKPVRFLLQSEISNIYKYDTKVRKVHNLLFAPDFECAERLSVLVGKSGKLESDGRPILGLDSRLLLEMTQSISSRMVLVPAHIWTPWFSVLGSKSGFDSIEECFRDYSNTIFAVETGLSSDPAMNWRLSALDKFTLISNSDAHSPSKLAREATIFDTALSFEAMMQAMRTREGFLGTIEFFPEEGKYHYDGHRKCKRSMKPEETRAHQGLCPVCGRPVTVGVLHRVEDLADRPVGFRPPGASPFDCLLSLPAVLAELLETGVDSSKVRDRYQRLLHEFGSELRILRDIPIADLDQVEPRFLGLAIQRIRASTVQVDAGYDGEFGTIKVFAQGELKSLFPQKNFLNTLFTDSHKNSIPSIEEHDTDIDNKLASSNSIDGNVSTKTKQLDASGTMPRIQRSLFDVILESESPGAAILDGLNENQRKAATTSDHPILIIAGPGSGKTRTLTSRIAYHLECKTVAPEQIIAITFTNRAAEEMRRRLHGLVTDKSCLLKMSIGTFHSFCYELLRSHVEEAGIDPGVGIIDEASRHKLLELLIKMHGIQVNVRHAAEWISDKKSGITKLDEPGAEIIAQLKLLYDQYTTALSLLNVLDYDDLLLKSVNLLQSNSEVKRSVHSKAFLVAIDEFQDINPIQYELVRLIAEKTSDICAIGDPDQSIYGFRGADPLFFKRFAADFQKTEQIHLNQSYRSTECIVKASSQVMRQNQTVMRPLVQGGTKIVLHEAQTERAEAEFISHSIEKLIGGTSFFSMDTGRVDSALGGELTYGFSDIAVLYRIHSLGDSIEEALTTAGIPCFRVEKEKKQRDPIIRLLFNYAKIALGMHSNLDWIELFSSPYSKITRETIMLLQQHFLNSDFEVYLHSQLLLESILTADRKRLIKINSNIAGFRYKLETIRRSLFQEILFGISPELTEDQKALLREYEQTLSHSGYDYQRFFQRHGLLTEEDSYDPVTERISLMTIHAAKGLEFPVVFILGCEEGMIPFIPLFQKEEVDFEEERRILYVGMTRAKELLYLTHSKKREYQGKLSTQAPSRYLKQIQEELLRREQLKKKSPHHDVPKVKQLELFKENK